VESSIEWGGFVSKKGWEPWWKIGMREIEIKKKTERNE